MKSIYILGNGQLGRMLRQAGEPLGIRVYPVGIDAEPDEISYENGLITAEIERWPQTPLTQALASHQNFINRDIFPRLADRLPQKTLLDSLSLATAPWQVLNNQQQWPNLFAQLGEFVIVKRRIGGYDGRGQWRVRIGDEGSLPDDIYRECIVEQTIPFEEEISLIGARNAAGDCVFYPITHNYHQNGILRASIAFAYSPSHLQSQAESMLRTILSSLKYIGVMAMECFVIDGKLLINELAPRVHNSGHWTQNGASISQFELHLRALLNLPLPQPDVHQIAVMLNIIGTPLDTQWICSSLVNLHWYDKAVRAGRKLGHINLVHMDPSELKKNLMVLQPIFPEDYDAGFLWLNEKLV